MSDQRHRVQADHSERDAALLQLLRQAGDFDVRMARLTVGDYLINDDVLIERKTIADFAASLVDGRLFPQAARLARDGHRTLMLVEGPPGASMPDVHPHAVQGALVSLAAMWRLPGEFPPRALRLVLEWAQLHRQELLDDWERARRRQPLERIPPLE